ncbi:unnamed protein product [Trichogramma brassicae]|uniref:Uncharacterized protein n=1 Tax=Trichogramma brassicae TaxID=86971 RepID=A0A6H5J8I9_9HYME|nr:unnamed protein product [Trichogramma brassicae]
MSLITYVDDDHDDQDDENDDDTAAAVQRWSQQTSKPGGASSHHPGQQPANQSQERSLRHGEPEQDEKSLNETILQTKKPRDGDRPSAGRWCTTGADGGCVFTPQMIAVLTETIRREVGIAVAQEIAKLSRGGEASADAGGTSAGLGLRSSPSRDSGLTPKIRKPPRKCRAENGHGGGS